VGQSPRLPRPLHATRGRGLDPRPRDPGPAATPLGEPRQRCRSCDGCGNGEHDAPRRPRGALRGTIDECTAVADERTPCVPTAGGVPHRPERGGSSHRAGGGVSAPSAGRAARRRAGRRCSRPRRTA
jgi:hypothetical protein